MQVNIFKILNLNCGERCKDMNNASQLWAGDSVSMA